MTIVHDDDVKALFVGQFGACRTIPGDNHWCDRRKQQGFIAYIGTAIARGYKSGSPGATTVATREKYHAAASSEEQPRNFHCDGRLAAAANRQIANANHFGARSEGSCPSCAIRDACAIDPAERR